IIGVVVRNRLSASGRRGPVLPAATCGCLVLAGFCGLEERELKFSNGRSPLLHLGRERGDSPVRRIHNQRRAATGVLDGLKDGIVGAADVLFRATLLPQIASK